jgi:hypothetical protein
VRHLVYKFLKNMKKKCTTHIMLCIMHLRSFIKKKLYGLHKKDKQYVNIHTLKVRHPIMRWWRNWLRNICNSCLQLVAQAPIVSCHIFKFSKNTKKICNIYYGVYVVWICQVSPNFLKVYDLQNKDKWYGNSYEILFTLVFFHRSNMVIFWNEIYMCARHNTFHVHDFISCF